MCVWEISEYMSAANEDPAGVKNLTSVTYHVCAGTEGGLDVQREEIAFPAQREGCQGTATVSGRSPTRPGRDRGTWWAKLVCCGPRKV